MNILLRRTLTGAGIVIFLLGGFWLHPVSFVITGLLILAGTQSEYYNLISHTGIRPQKTAGLVTGISAYLLAAFVAAGMLPPKAFLVLFLFTTVVFVTELYRKEINPFDSLSHTFLPLLYTAVPLSLFPFAAFSRSGLQTILPHREVVFSPGFVIGFFVLLWAYDTGAYLSGITLGRRKLMPRISPAKTWEGCIGGFIISAALAWALSGWFGVISAVHWIVVSGIIAVAGTYGDLVESMLKRSLDVKDSGTILPGHGGFLDRFDSTLLSFPIVYLFISVFG